MMRSGPLPIEEELPRIRAALSRHPCAVLQAPPGAGKTTLVPLALLDAAWLAGNAIVMLEPRRLAARAAARRMADLLDDTVGGTVGYRIHLDSAVGPRTRVEVVTEGILARRLQRDPALDGVGLLIFDEFHERSIHADLGLALALDVQRTIRPDLRILAMSATLDGDAVAALMGGGPVLTSTGRCYSVETRYAPRDPGRRIEQAVVPAILHALGGERGSVLVFLPGAGEIRAVEAALGREVKDPRVLVAPLHGTLSRAAQDAALLPAPEGMRKIVLASSIAETNLTIEGIRIVIDSGLMRVPRFDPRSGMSRLETVRVTRASADQRRGRAGRVEPGICFRLWTETAHASLELFTTPEILGADLAPLALELAAWGVADPMQLAWLDPPPAGSYAQARGLLAALGALDAHGCITPHGRRMAAMGAHPRLAHMMLACPDARYTELACTLAAVLSERDILRASRDETDPDIRRRLDILRAHDGGGEAVRHVRASARYWHQRLPADVRTHAAHHGRLDDSDMTGPLLALAYPDRIAQRRAGTDGSFLLTNGRGAQFTAPTPLAHEDYCVIADLDAGGRSARIFMAAPYSLEHLLEQCGDRVTTRRIVQWDDAKGTVVARQQRLLDALVIKDDPLADVPDDECAVALVGGIARRGIEALPWDAAARQVQARVIFLRATLGTEWPDMGDQALLATLDGWLEPLVRGMRKLDEVRRLDLAAILRGMLSWRQRTDLDALAPTHLDVPSGSHVPVDYTVGTVPVLAVRVQEMFGLTDTPRIAGGAVPVLIHFLSPAGRPVQVTQDLASFWRSAYHQVKKDLKGRYPKHFWPDDPLVATPTRRAKRPRA